MNRKQHGREACAGHSDKNLMKELKRKNILIVISIVTAMFLSLTAPLFQ